MARAQSYRHVGAYSSDGGSTDHIDLQEWKPYTSVKAAAADLRTNGVEGSTITIRKLPAPVPTDNWDDYISELDDWKLGMEQTLTKGPYGGVLGAGL